ncbi:hypothetical protein ACS0PU_011245 [Formica fusca]
MPVTSCNVHPAAVCESRAVSRRDPPVSESEPVPSANAPLNFYNSSNTLIQCFHGKPRGRNLVFPSFHCSSDYKVAIQTNWRISNVRLHFSFTIFHYNFTNYFVINFSSMPFAIQS